MITITNREARQFMLLKHGLLGDYKLIGKQGVLNYVRQTGCIQYDPIDICGRNAELTLQSRVKGFTKETLYKLLYEDRLLLDYPDKNTAIIHRDDWIYFSRSRDWPRRRAAEHPEMQELMEQALAIIREKGVVSPDDIKLESDFKWRAYVVWSSGKNLSASVLEQLYGIGELVIHHKDGARKYYDLTERYIPSEILSAPDPHHDDFEHLKWRVARYIGAVGMLWCRPSDALPRMTAETRSKVFALLLDEGRICDVKIEGIKDTLYFRAEDMPIMEQAQENHDFPLRCEFIAPLDPFMWDRKVIKAIFGFEYTWEIYTPVVKRKYGHYVLPILFGERFVGRIEPIVDKKARTLTVKNIWYEDDVKPTKATTKAVEKCLARFSRFNGCVLDGGLPNELDLG
ncbi:MAG: winged helix DNA-binding domain-containing protein [Oscillospiraceae bacterium]|nr:winged helix DNA-binding domain-containing protein [Oscillospiraceae bacterium]